MPCTIERLQGRPIILIAISDPFDPAQEMAAGMKQFLELASDVPGKVFRLIDISRWNLPFSELVEGLANDTRVGPKVATDPRVSTVVIGSSEMVKLGTAATKQKQYGYANAPVLCGSMDEALAHIEAQLAHAVS